MPQRESGGAWIHLCLVDDRDALATAHTQQEWRDKGHARCQLQREPRQYLDVDHKVKHLEADTLASARKRPFFEFSLCLSRACLGQTIIFSNES